MQLRIPLRKWNSINRMLCERTARARFATLFWGIYDAGSSMLRYQAGSVRIEPGDRLVLFSDGINEAANANQEEFGEDRLAEAVVDGAEATPQELCERIMEGVQLFASEGPAPDDRTLMVVSFPRAAGMLERRKTAAGILAVA